MLAPVDYDDRQHAVYAKARAIHPAMLAQWMEIFAEYLPERRPLSVIDLGSGAGRFTPALAEAFGGPVWGVEPSAKMRENAERDATHSAVTHLAGEAAHIPLPDASADAVLLFLSFHHAPDKRAAAREIARVLRPGGRVLMRGQFGDRPPACWWDPYFPSFRGLQVRMFPTLGETLDAFVDAGLHRRDLREVEETYFEFGGPGGRAPQAARHLRLRASERAGNRNGLRPHRRRLCGRNPAGQDDRTKRPAGSGLKAADKALTL